MPPDGYEAVMRMLTSDRRPRAVIVPERPQHGCPCALLATYHSSVHSPDVNRMEMFQAPGAMVKVLEGRTRPRGHRLAVPQAILTDGLDVMAKLE